LPVEGRDTGRSRVFPAGHKPVNTIDSRRAVPQAGGSMSRTPNAAKSIFAFVARISLR
jgi:hypothetical protein